LKRAKSRPTRSERTDSRVGVAPADALRRVNALGRSERHGGRSPPETRNVYVLTESHASRAGSGISEQLEASLPVTKVSVLTESHASVASVRHVRARMKWAS
jgi:hypothetical protein